MAAIYAEDALARTFAAGFDAAALSDAEIVALSEFHTSDLGRRLAGAGIAARRDLQDPAVAEAAVRVVADRRVAGADIVAVLEAYHEATGLPDLNRLGAVATNLAFYRGLVDADLYDPPPAPSEMRAEVRGRAGALGAASDAWLEAYHLLVLDGLSRAERADLVDHTQTPAAQTAIRVIFAAFDAMHADAAYQMGSAAGPFVRPGGG